MTSKSIIITALVMTLVLAGVFFAGMRYSRTQSGGGAAGETARLDASGKLDVQTVPAAQATETRQGVVKEVRASENLIVLDSGSYIWVLPTTKITRDGKSISFSGVKVGDKLEARLVNAINQAVEIKLTSK